MHIFIALEESSGKWPKYFLTEKFSPNAGCGGVERWPSVRYVVVQCCFSMQCVGVSEGFPSDAG